MLSGSLRPRGAPPPQGVEFVPDGATLAAYSDVFALIPLAGYLRNSVIVVAIAVPLTLLVASLAGYAIRLLGPRPKRVAIGLSLVAMMVPVTAVWATRFEVFRVLGVIDTFVPLVATALLGTNPFLVLIYAWAFHRVPDEILDAAALDGAGVVRTWWSVSLPLVRPATLAVAVLAFTFHWSNFIDPLLYLNTASNYTAPLGLRLLQQLNPTDWPLLLAGCVVVTLPVLAVFLAGQRVFLDDPVHALDSLEA